MNRQDALDLLCEYTKNKNLIKHGLAVEAVMRYYAKKLGRDEDEWGITGLLHDFDYEKYPTTEEHAIKGSEILRSKGYPESIITAILGHAKYTGIPRRTDLAKVLFASDELSGFIIAVTLVMPNKKLSEVDIKSVVKKLKNKKFAKQVNRDEIKKSAEEINIDLDKHITNCLNALKPISGHLGL